MGRDFGRRTTITLAELREYQEESRARAERERREEAARRERARRQVRALRSGVATDAPLGPLAGDEGAQRDECDPETVERYCEPPRDAWDV